MSDKYQEFFEKLQKSTQLNSLDFKWFSKNEKDIVDKLLHRSAHIDDGEMEEIYKNSIYNSTIQRAMIKSDFISPAMIDKILKTTSEKIVYKEALSIPLKRNLLEICINNIREAEIEDMFDFAIMNVSTPPINQENINLMVEYMPEKFNFTHYQFLSDTNKVNEIIAQDDVNEEKVIHLINNQYVSDTQKDLLFTKFGCDINRILSPTPFIAEEIYKSSAEALFEYEVGDIENDIFINAEKNIKNLLLIEKLPPDLQYDLYLRLTTAEKDNASAKEWVKMNIMYVLAKKATDTSLLSNGLFEFSIEKRINTNKHFPVDKVALKAEFINAENKDIVSKKLSIKSLTDANIPFEKLDKESIEKIRSNNRKIADLFSLYKVNNVNNIYESILSLSDEIVLNTLASSTNTPLNILEKIKENNLVAKINYELRKNNIDENNVEQVIKEFQNDTPFLMGYGTCLLKEKEKILNILENMEIKNTEKPLLISCCDEIREEIELNREVSNIKPEWAKDVYQFGCLGTATVIDAQKFLNASMDERREFLNVMTPNSLKRELRNIEYLFLNLEDRITFYEIIDKYIKTYNILEQCLKVLELAENSKELKNEER